MITANRGSQTAIAEQKPAVSEFMSQKLELITLHGMVQGEG